MFGKPGTGFKRGQTVSTHNYVIVVHKTAGLILLFSTSPVTARLFDKQICSLASSQSSLLPRPSCLLRSQSQSQSQPPRQPPRLHLSSSHERTWGASSTLSVRHTARYREYLALTLGSPPVSDGAGIWKNITSAAGDVATFVTSACVQGIRIHDPRSTCNAVSLETETDRPLQVLAARVILSSLLSVDPCMSSRLVEPTMHSLPLRRLAVKPTPS